MILHTGNLRTTAMGILPHTDVDRALELSLSLDIPFWPQLPHLHFNEDMYAQASEGFPGILVDVEEERVTLDSALFYEQLETYAERSADPANFALSPEYAAVYHRFLALGPQLGKYPAIRGQMTGPISFGLKVVDENLKPIIYNDDIRPILYDFFRNKINAQYRQLSAIHPQAFVWTDEPGLELLFSSFTGYTGERAKADLGEMLAGVEGPRGVHLCGNPDWDFLLSTEMDILSFDAYTNGHIFTRYATQIGRFLEAGHILSWGVIPTATEDFAKEQLETILRRIEDMWDYLVGRGVDKAHILHQGLLAPAKCCLMNPDKTVTVERTFDLLRQVSARLRDKYALD
jgi:hypothetical protein